MHSFEVNSRICQPKNSDVHRGEALLYDTVSLFLVLFKYFHIYKFTHVRCFSALKTRIFQQVTSEVSETLMRCAKMHF